MTDEQIREYEAMAKLELDGETRRWALDAINGLEGSFRKLSNADAKGAAPMVSVLGIGGALREDAAIKIWRREQLLALAPEERDGYFQAPRTLE